MDIPIFEKLHAKGIISDDSLRKVKEQEGKKILSVHWELKTILYLGVLLLSTGLGIAIYKNIDTIGHQAILAFIAGISIACFYYCIKHKFPFSTDKVDAPNPYFDYALLLGCLTMISFVGYLQFQYQVFGIHYGLASFIPMLLLFFCAYYFDHLGVLSLGITNLAAWAGIAITPLSILKENDFDSGRVIVIGVLLGIALLAAAMFTKNRMLKPHFEFTYSNFGVHLLFISCLAAMFYFDGWYLLWFLLLAGACYFFYTKAMAEKSFYYILLLTLYGYVGLSYVVVRLLFFTDLEVVAFYLAFFYFIGSGIWLVRFLMNMNKKLKAL